MLFQYLQPAIPRNQCGCRVASDPLQLELFRAATLRVSPFCRFQIRSGSSTGQFGPQKEPTPTTVHFQA